MHVRRCVFKRLTSEKNMKRKDKTGEPMALVGHISMTYFLGVRNRVSGSLNTVYREALYAGGQGGNIGSHRLIYLIRQGNYPSVICDSFCRHKKLCVKHVRRLLHVIIRGVFNLYLFVSHRTPVWTFARLPAYVVSESLVGDSGDKRRHYIHVKAAGMKTSMLMSQEGIQHL